MKAKRLLVILFLVNFIILFLASCGSKKEKNIIVNEENSTWKVFYKLEDGTPKNMKYTYAYIYGNNFENLLLEKIKNEVSDIVSAHSGSQHTYTTEIFKSDKYSNLYFITKLIEYDNYFEVEFIYKLNIDSKVEYYTITAKFSHNSNSYSVVV